MSLTNPMASMYVADPSDSWCIDSGASQHMTPQVQRISQPQPYAGIGFDLVGNGCTLPISHTGSSSIKQSTHSILIHDVLCVPSLTRNLLSIQKFSHDNNYFFLLDDSGFCAKDKSTGKAILSGPSSDGIYSTNPSQSRQHFTCLNACVSSSIWHQRLGHPSSPIL